MRTRRPPPITFTRGRHLYQIVRRRADDDGFVGLRDGRIVARGPNPAWVAHMLIAAANRTAA